MLGDKRFLRTIRPRNILSFGPDTPELELQSLNVLIGPNGAGKSNLIEVIGILKAVPGNLFEPIQTGGGIAEWLWKGSDQPSDAIIETTVAYHRDPLRHKLRFAIVGQHARLTDEEIEKEKVDKPGDIYYGYGNGHPMINRRQRSGRKQTRRIVQGRQVAPDISVISQRKEPDLYPEITYLGREYARIKLFREWDLGHNTPPRRPQPTDLPGDYLNEDAANVALVLNDLEHRSNLRANLLAKLRSADESIANFSTKVIGGTIQLFVHYSGLKSPVPATRLSDGTMRYLCLLAVLCHPEPPPLVCLEEPELGLHPDLLPGLADLMVEASHRMQLIVTTHSDALVDGLTKVPEAIVVCEKRNGSTQMRRHTSEELAAWLKDYGLGQLWRSGEIGGNRW